MRALLIGLTIVVAFEARTAAAADQPNILLCISDDQSYPYMSAYGTAGINTPAFDRIAKEGVLFNNAYAASPGCSPSRAALLTGRHCWQLEHAGTHASHFATKYKVYPDILEADGYFVGATGKGWGPGNYKISGRTRNPAGTQFQDKKFKKVPKGIRNTDYAGNFEEFIAQKPDDKPFCFWMGGSEPHRVYKKGIGLENGKKLEDAVVPTFLPDTSEIRSDILDYCYEIEWFDNHVDQALKLLAEKGELDNTLIVYTADNGMPFPRAKANGYEYGIHVPMAIRYGAKANAGRTVNDLVGFVDLSPTFHEAAGIEIADDITGKSLMNILTSDKSGTVDETRTHAWSSRERHSSSRYNNLTYPIRSMRTPQYLYIRHFRPDRWPAGSPAPFKKDTFGYYDIDGCPSKTFLWEKRNDPELGKYFLLSVDKRDEIEIYDVKKDPGNLNNLAGDAAFAAQKTKLTNEFESYLRETGDPRIIDGGDVWETYKRYSHIRSFPEPDSIDVYGKATSNKSR
ncbi:sulfatase [bacterium]|nr:sulfatase [bacterium]